MGWGCYNQRCNQPTDRPTDYRASPDFLLDLLDFWNLEIGNNFCINGPKVMINQKYFFGGVFLLLRVAGLLWVLWVFGSVINNFCFPMSFYNLGAVVGGHYWLSGFTSLFTTTSPRGSCPLSLSWTPTTAQSTTRGCLSSTCTRDCSCS